MPYDVFGAMKAKCLPIGMGFERIVDQEVIAMLARTGGIDERCHAGRLDLVKLGLLRRGPR